MLGTDSRIRNCFIMGVGSSGGAIASVGANFYTDDKFDSIGPTVQYIFYQGASATVQENHFIDCDFSATTTSSGITINDTNNNAITTFQGSITSTTINIVAARMTMFSAMEFGGAVTSAAPISVVGSYGLSALTFTGTGARSCAGNTNITC
jgi:hypothetical protein